MNLLNHRIFVGDDRKRDGRVVMLQKGNTLFIHNYWKGGFYVAGASGINKYYEPEFVNKSSLRYSVGCMLYDIFHGYIEYEDISYFLGDE